MSARCVVCSSIDVTVVRVDKTTWCETCDERDQAVANDSATTADDAAAIVRRAREDAHAKVSS